jgi:uncharacterized membrane protein YhaH (DUF805 family)
MKLLALLFSPAGSLPRQPYAIAVACVLVAFVLTFIATDLQKYLLDAGLGAIRLPIMLAILWSLIVLLAKRNRDLGRSPWLSLLVLIPGVGLIVLVVSAVLRGDSSPPRD